MAVKSTETKSAAAAAKSDPAAETTEAAPARASRDCVVDADFHVGRATPGSKVCSYHAMHYLADGTPRSA